MNKPILKSLVVAGALTMGIAACSSSPASGPSGTAKGQPLVIVDNTGQTFTQSFNPFVSTSIGNSNNTTALIYEPLLMFNIMQPTQPPIPWLATAYKWSDGGKTLTLTIRKGVKFSDGKPMTASDVAFSFNLLKNNPTLTPVSPPPIPLTATAPNPTTAVLTFSQPEFANLFLIGGMYIVPQHVWQGISNPVTFADPDPVGTGPYVISKFSSQKYTLTQNMKYWQLSKVHVPSIIFPNFVSNDTANPALANGQIDYAGNAVSNVSENFLAKSPDNHTWTKDQPWFSDNNVVTLWLNVTRAPLNDPKVRLAISAGINRTQLSVQGETNYEPPATLLQRPAAADRREAARLDLRERPQADLRPRHGHQPAEGRRLDEGQRQVDQERQDHQVRHRGPVRLHRLRHRRPAHRHPAEQPGLRCVVQGRPGHAVVRRLPGRQLRRDDPLEQPGPQPVLLLPELAGQLAVSADRQASRQ